MSNFIKTFCCVIASLFLVAIIVGGLFLKLTPTGRIFVNNWKYSLQKADDSSLYETKKEVEDTCRAMISSYNADKLTYETYMISDNEEESLWATQAKIRANKTASSYNNYILKNSFVWEDNIPSDIYMTLEYIE